MQPSGGDYSIGAGKNVALRKLCVFGAYRPDVFGGFDVANRPTLRYNHPMKGGGHWDLIGHEWAVALLAEHVARQEVRHAYLFVGPKGIGRRTLALRLAQALNCLHPPSPGEACGQCRICDQTGRMQHADLAVVQAEQEGGTLKVDQIRTLQRSLALSPYEARYRMALLLRFEEANHNAMNALLKTLEEPAPQVVLAVTAESPESLLPTIVSRCEVIRLRPLSVEQVTRGLKERRDTLRDIEDEQLNVLAHISGGRPGYAIHLGQHPDLLEIRTKWLEEHWRLMTAGRVERFASAEKLAKNQDDLRSAIQIWLSYWRDVLLRAAGSSVPVANLDRLNEIDNLSGWLTVDRIAGFISKLERALVLLDRNANARLTAEVLLLDLPFIVTKQYDNRVFAGT